MRRSLPVKPPATAGRFASACAHVRPRRLGAVPRSRFATTAPAAPPAPCGCPRAPRATPPARGTSRAPSGHPPDRRRTFSPAARTPQGRDLLLRDRHRLAQALAPGELLQARRQVVHAQLAQVAAVHPAQLLLVEDRRVLGHPLEREQLLQLLDREEGGRFVVAPAQQGEVIDHCFS